jgi:exonuclease SbcC
MMKWKISKIKIDRFKAFDVSIFDFENCDLITLDGPNGYGKTTVFDAIELLLTGRIDRVLRLFETVMSRKKLNYDDNLYWNVKGGRFDLCIRAEFVNHTSGEKLSVARMAKVVDLSIQKQNRADKFDFFKLYKLRSFESNDFSEEVTDEIFNRIFGRNFISNFSLLNYMEQGQNTFLFSKSTEMRKEALSELVDSRWLQDHLKKCKAWEAKIQSQYLSAAMDEKERQMTSIISRYSTQIAGDTFNETFSRISTIEPPPTWDTIAPFKEPDPEVYQLVFIELTKLKEIVVSKEEVRKRLKNSAIDQYISEKKYLFEKLVSIGSHIGEYATLKDEHTFISNLAIQQEIFQKSTSISATEADVLIGRKLVGDNLLFLIAKRDALKQNIGEKSVAIAELVRLRDEILKRFREIRNLDSVCPLCGHDWEAAQALQQAIEDQYRFEEKSQSDLGIEYQSTLNLISQILSAPAATNGAELTKRSGLFQRELFDALQKNQEHFNALNLIDARLKSLGIVYMSEFTNDETELNRRVEQLLISIRSIKEQEAGDLPSDWQTIVDRLFQSKEDFYSLSENLVAQKFDYINFKYSQLRISALNKLQADLSKFRKQRAAATILKERISKLRTELSKLEKDYSSQVLSEIELTFHIYSGRLIQNYQRGLGLFIEHGDGKELRFATAVRSDHDALLSMSSGQIAALSLAFFFSLNKVYSKSALILIDDPAQSLDEINIASLSDLLRSELKGRQILISSHEDDISAYIRYRFARAGLAQKGIHMQRHARNNRQIA